MELSSDARWFKCVSSTEVFVYGNSFAKQLYYSLAGSKFYEIVCTGARGTPDQNSVSFFDPHHNRSGKLKRNFGQMIWGRKVFTLISPQVRTINVVPLPNIRVSEYLFKLDHGVLFYVSRDMYTSSYDGFKAFVGFPPYVARTQIVSIKRLPDGGTTLIKTAIGELYVPTTLGKKKKPTWNGKPAKRLDPKGYVFEEEPHTITIVKR